MKRGDWIRTSSTINKRYRDRVGRIVTDNIEELPTRTHVEHGVKFENGGVLAWFLPSELTVVDKPRRASTIALLPVKKSRAEPLVEGVA